MKKKNLLASIAVMGFVFAGSQLAVHADETEPTIKNEAQPAPDAGSTTVEESAALPEQSPAEDKSESEPNLTEIYTNDLPTAEQKVHDAQEELENVTSQTSTVQEEVDQTKVELDAAKDHLAGAEETSKKADADAEGIDDKVIQDDRQEYDAAKEKYDNAAAVHDTAKNNYDALSQKKDALAKESDELNTTYTKTENEIKDLQKQIPAVTQEIADAQKRVDELVLRPEWKDEYEQAVDALTKLQKELADLQAVQDKLQAETDAITDKVNAKKDEKAGYEADIAAAEKTKADKEAEKADTQKKAEEAPKKQVQMQAAFDKALADKEAADKKVKQDEQDIQNQNARLEAAKKAKEEADKHAEDEAQKRLADAKAQYSKGSAGFFDYLARQGNKDAEQAYKILTAKGTEMQDGYNKDVDISGYTHLGQPGDATCLENMKVAVDHLDDVNAYRQNENKTEGTNLQDLKVTHSLMAIAQWDANYSASNLGHAQVFKAAENVAWGSGNPYDRWYDSEKEVYKSGENGVIGHYKNIVDPDYVAHGYAVVAGDNVPMFGIEWAQTFASGSPYGWSDYAEGAITVAQYQEIFNEYYKAVIKEQEDAEKFLNDLKSGANVKTEGQKKAEKELAEAQQAYDQAAANLNTSKASQTTAHTKANKAEQDLTDAKNAAKAFEEKMTALGKDIEKAEADRKAAEAGKTRATDELAELKSSENEATGRLEEAKINTNAQKTVTDKQQAVTAVLENEKKAFDTAKAEALNSLNDAKTRLETFRNRIPEAEKELVELTAKMAENQEEALDIENNLPAAAKKLKEAEKELAEAEKVYTAARDKYEADTALKKAAEDARAKVEKLKKDIAGFEADILEGKDRLAELKAKTSELTEYVNNGQKHIEKLKTYPRTFVKDGFTVQIDITAASVPTDLSNLELVVTRLEKPADNYGLSGGEAIGFDLHLINPAGEEVPVTGKISVLTAVPKGKKLVGLYHKADKDGEAASLSWKQAGNMYQFDTESFSWFIFVYKNEPKSSSSRKEDPTVSAGVTATQPVPGNVVSAPAGTAAKTSPNTGVGESTIGYSTVLLLSAASLAGVFAETKRRNRK